MLPVLLDLGFLKIYTFGVFLVLALFWGLFWYWRSIRLTGYKETELFDGVFVGIIGGAFISRVVYVVCNFGDFGVDLLKFILVNGYPGASMYGFILGGMLIYSLFLLRKHYHVGEMLDYLIPALFISISVAKVGSFIAGVDVGTTTSLPVAVTYIGHEGTRHLVALYEAALALVGFVVSYKLLLGVRRKVFPQGVNLYFFFLFFGASVLLLDNLKENHLYFARFSINLIVSLPFFVVGAGYFIYTYRKEIKNSLGRAGAVVQHHVKKSTTTLREAAGKKTKKGTHPSREENS